MNDRADEYKTSPTTTPDDVLQRIARNHRMSQKRDRDLRSRIDILATRVKGLYIHIAALSTLIVGDIVARYVSSK